MAEIRRALVFADYFQFYVRDVEAHDAELRAGGATRADRPPAGWTRETDVHRIGIEPHSISAGTARREFVETTLEVHPGPPSPAFTEAEHIVEADMQVPTGVLHVHGCLDDPRPEYRSEVPAGRYRVRVSYMPTESPPAEVDPDEPGDHYSYRVDIWAAPELASLVVVKQGPNPWAG